MKMPVDFLASRCLDLGITPRVIVEIGVYKGDSSELFLHYWPDADLYLVDPWKPQPDGRSRMYDVLTAQEQWDEIYRGVCARFKMCDNVHIIRADSQSADYFLPDNIDLAFVDGMHTYEAVREDVAMLSPKMAANSLLSGHDYTSARRHAGVKKAVNELFDRDQIVVGTGKTWSVHYG